MKLAVLTVASASILRGKQPDGYDPVQLLCAPGGEVVQGWCQNWLECIKEKSQPEGLSKVKDSWAPAPCEEVCGVWPVTTPAEGSDTTLLQGSKNGAVSKAMMKDCMDSCANFQESLSNCVGTILFEPGQLSSMTPRENTLPESESCKAAKEICLPDLPIKYQQCVSNKASVKLDTADAMHEDCERIFEEFEECRNCPSMEGSFASEFTAFTGGCMDQLHAYHQATHPAAAEAAIPGATGCTVH